MAKSDDDAETLFARMPRICTLVNVPTGMAVMGCRMMVTQPFMGRADTLAFVSIVNPVARAS